MVLIKRDRKKHTKSKPKSNLNQKLTLRTAHKCVHINVHYWSTQQRNTAQNSSDNRPPSLQAAG